MKDLIKAYYNDPEALQEEVITYLETISEIVNNKEEITNDILMTFIAINKINKAIHKNLRIEFLCDFVESSIFLFTISDDNPIRTNRENKYTNLAGNLLLNNYK